jgi:hypothetical protein
LSTATSIISTTTSSASTALIAYDPNISTSSIHFNTPPPFGTSRTQMINATSTGQYLSPTATGSSQEKTGATATQSLSGSNTPTPLASVVAGLGARPDVMWSHVFVWAAGTEIVLGFL